MITPPLRPIPLLYVDMTPPSSFDISIPATTGFPPALVIAGRLKLLKPSGDEVTWACAIIPDDEQQELILRRAIVDGDLDESGIWSMFAEVQFGTSPGNWMRVAARTVPVLATFQTQVPP